MTASVWIDDCLVFLYILGDCPVNRRNAAEKCSMEEKPVRSLISVTDSSVVNRYWEAAAIRASVSFWEKVLPKFC